MREYLKRVESKMTAEQMQKAFALARANGWSNGEPPAWVWLQFFHQAAPWLCERVSDEMNIEGAPDLWKRIEAVRQKHGLVG